MTDFLNNARREDLSLRTDVTSAKLKGRMGNGIQAQLQGSRRDRTGDKAFGGSFGFNNVVETVEPVRQKMASAGGKVSYTRNRLTVEGDAGYTAFENSNTALVWDNPRQLTDATGNPGKGKLDLYPDNQSWHVMGLVGLQLPRRTAFTGTYSFGQATQNDDWLPFTVNSAVLAPDTFPLPSTQSYAKANISTFDARITSHPVARVGGTLRYHRYEYQNKTPQWTLSGQVPYDGAWSGTDVTSHPFGNEQTVAGLDVDWNPLRQLGLYGTVERIDRKHTFREVPEDHETAYEAKARAKPTTGIQVDARYRHGEREVDEFEEEDYQNASGQFIEQPELRRYDVAARTQDLVEGSVSWAGIEKATVSLLAGYLRNEYTETHLGLQDDLRRSVGAEATLDPTDRLSLTGAFGWVRIDTNQQSRQSSGGTLVQSDSTNWQARLRDEIVSASGSVEFAAIPDRVALSASYWYERSPGTFDLSGFEALSTVPGAQDLPATVYMRQGVGINARYTFQDGFDVVARWGWEEMHLVDFANQDIPLLSPVTGAANAIYLGDETLNYRASAIAVALNRTF
jgi:MtrB/PioB family decaheme-associated outer membrane protein